MASSPYAHAAMVGTVHGGTRLEPSDDWPYMRTAADGFATAVARPSTAGQRQQTAAGGRPRAACSPPGADWNPPPSSRCGGNESDGDDGDGPERPNAYTKLVKSPMLPFSAVGLPKHVFKVRETSKLLLFLGAAIGGILILDLSARLIVSIAHSRCAHARVQ
jgi:hypothetical protein